MARRNNHSREELRQMVIDAGFNLIANGGFRTFSTRQVAKEIGYTVGTLYNVFKGYDDIILHINAKILDDMKSFIEHNINPDLQGIESLKNLSKIYLEYAQNQYNCWSMFFEYSFPADLELPEWYNEKIGSLFAIVEKDLSEYITSKSELSKHSRIIWASIHGICILNLTKKLDVPAGCNIESWMNSLIENYLKGLVNA